jgi:hypothetical protein
LAEAVAFSKISHTGNYNTNQRSASVYNGLDSQGFFSELPLEYAADHQEDVEDLEAA